MSVIRTEQLHEDACVEKNFTHRFFGLAFCQRRGTNLCRTIFWCQYASANRDELSLSLIHISHELVSRRSVEIFLNEFAIVYETLQRIVYSHLRNTFRTVV